MPVSSVCIHSKCVCTKHITLKMEKKSNCLKWKNIRKKRLYIVTSTTVLFDLNIWDNVVNHLDNNHFSLRHIKQ